MTTGQKLSANVSTRPLAVILTSASIDPRTEGPMRTLAASSPFGSKNVTVDNYKFIHIACKILLIHLVRNFKKDNRNQYQDGSALTHYS